MNKQFSRVPAWAGFFCLLWAAPGLAGTAQYTYDSLNRLTQVQNDDGSSIQYTYDAAGNRLVQHMAGFAPLQAPS